MTVVVQMATVHPPFDPRTFHRECHTSVSAGFETYLIVHNDTGNAMVEGVQIISLGSIPKIRLSLRPMSRLRAVWRAKQLAQRLPADIYHIQSPELIPLGLWLRRTTKAKVIFDGREDYVGYARQRPHLHAVARVGLARLMRFLEATAAKHFDAVVTADQGVTDIYRRYGARHVITIHNFPRLDQFPHLQSDTADYDLVYHGSIPRYHLETAFAVATELQCRGRHVRWLFFGRCPEMTWALSEIERRGLQNCFTITGPVPHEQVACKVRAARIGIIPLPDLPKFQHNIPMKLFEFMALGMPVVLSDLPPSQPFVGDEGCAILVPPGDYDAYADAIIRLLDNPMLCRQMGIEGRRRIEREFNWEKEGVKLIDLYAELSPP